MIRFNNWDKAKSRKLDEVVEVNFFNRVGLEPR